VKPRSRRGHRVQPAGPSGARSPLAAAKPSRASRFGPGGDGAVAAGRARAELSAGAAPGTTGGPVPGGPDGGPAVAPRLGGRRGS
jgi:hypothetical protein